MEGSHKTVESYLRERQLRQAEELIRDHRISLKTSIECSNVYLTSFFLPRFKKRRAYLKRACQIGNREIVYLLIAFGYSLNEASIYSSGSLVRDLIDQGACPIYQNCKALQNAVKRRDLELVDYLLNNRADIKPGIDIALEKAVKIGDVRIVHTLLRSFADVSPKTFNRVNDENMRNLLLKYVIF